MECGYEVCLHSGARDTKGDNCAKCLELKEGDRCVDHTLLPWDEVDFDLNDIEKYTSLPSLGFNANTLTVAGF